jgi:cell division protease FtsH
MVRDFGLSPALGPVGYAVGGAENLDETTGQPWARPYSERTQRLIDQEAARLLREAEQHAISLLHAHRAALDRLAALLVEHETLDGKAVLAILAQAPEPTDAPQHPDLNDRPLEPSAEPQTT